MRTKRTFHVSPSISKFDADQFAAVHECRSLQKLSASPSRRGQFCRRITVAKIHSNRSGSRHRAAPQIARAAAVSASRSSPQRNGPRMKSLSCVRDASHRQQALAADIRICQRSSLGKGMFLISFSISLRTAAGDVPSVLLWRFINSAVGIIVRSDSAIIKRSTLLPHRTRTHQLWCYRGGRVKVRQAKRVRLSHQQRIERSSLAASIPSK